MLKVMKQLNRKRGSLIYLFFAYFVSASHADMVEMY